MKKNALNARVALKKFSQKKNLVAGIIFLALSIMLGFFYFKLGQFNRMILLYDIFLFLLASAYLLLDAWRIKIVGRSFFPPVYKFIFWATGGRYGDYQSFSSNRDSHKKQIYYSRTYRHLKPNFLRMSLFFGFFVIPSLIWFLLSYTDISRLMVDVVIRTCSNYIEASQMSIGRTSFIPGLGDISYIVLDGPLPSQKTSLIHALIMIIGILTVKISLKDQKHVRMYLFFTLAIHLTSAIYMYFGAAAFPYGLVDYSELYMKQQIGIWLSLFSIVTLLSGSINYTGLSKFVFVVCAMIYSVLFGLIRYSVFLGIMHHFSLIFMTSFFFSFGPFIDFLYLVWMYSLFMRFVTSRFNSERGVVEWYWA